MSRVSKDGSYGSYGKSRAGKTPRKGARRGQSSLARGVRREQALRRLEAEERADRDGWGS